MSTREDAQKLLIELYSNIPGSLYRKIEETQRGFGFVLSYLEKADGEVNAGDFSKSLFSIFFRTSFRQILPLTASKILAIRQYSCEFFPCH